MPKRGRSGAAIGTSGTLSIKFSVVFPKVLTEAQRTTIQEVLSPQQCAAAA
jgi:hypothetical protein